MQEIAGIIPQPIKLPGTAQAEPIGEGSELGLFAAMLLQLLGPSPQEHQEVPAEEQSLNGAAVVTEGASGRGQTPLTPLALEIGGEADKPQEAAVDGTAPLLKQHLSPQPEAPFPTPPGTVIVHDPPMVLSPEALLYRQPTKLGAAPTGNGELGQGRPEPSLPSQAPVMIRQAPQTIVPAQTKRPLTREPLRVQARQDDEPRPGRLLSRAVRGLVMPRDAVHPLAAKTLPTETWPNLTGLEEGEAIVDLPDLARRNGLEAVPGFPRPAAAMSLEPGHAADGNQGERLSTDRPKVDVPVEEKAAEFIVVEAALKSAKEIPPERIPFEPKASHPEEQEVREPEDHGEPDLKELGADEAAPKATSTVTVAKEPAKKTIPSQKVKMPPKAPSQELVREQEPVPLPDAFAEAGEKEAKIDQPEVSFRMVEGSMAPKFQGTERVANVPREVPREVPLAKGVAEQVIRQMNLEIRPGVQEVLIKLEPRELGDVRLRIISQDGAITARIAVETTSVKAIMESAMPELRTNLQQQGIQLVDFSVQVGTDGFSFDQASPQHRERQWTHGGKRGGAREEPAYVQVDTGWKLGRVDIRA